MNFSPASAPIPDPHSTPRTPTSLVNVAGLEGRRVEIASGGVKAAKLLIDGQEPPRGAKKNQWLVTLNNGQTVTAYLKNSFPDPAPLLIIGDQTVRTAPPLNVFQWIWAGFPIVLLFLGGAIGGALGAVALTVNAQILRSGRKGIMPYLLSGLVSLAVIGAWAGIVFLLRR